MFSNVWDEITYLFPNFNIATVEVWEWISNCHPPIRDDSDGGPGSRACFTEPQSMDGTFVVVIWVDEDRPNMF